MTFHNDEVGMGVESGAHRSNDFLGNATLDFLALAVVGVQVLRDGQRFGEVAGQEQA